MKNLFCTLLFTAFFVSVAFAQEGPKGVSVEAVAGTKYAILIGVNDYVRMSKLRYAKNDIEALRDELYKTGFEAKNVETLTCDGAPKNQPTKENIEFVVESVLEQAKEGDIVLVAMSGHGIEVEGEARFCPPATDPGDLLRTTVSIKNIFEALEKSGATFKLMIVDACRDNPFLSRNVAGASALQTLADPPKGVMLLQSSRSGQQSYEDSDLKRGVFTHYIVEGLRGKAADKDGKITLMRLIAYTMDETTTHVRNQFRTRQQPYLRGEMTDFVLANVAAPVIAPPRPAPAPVAESPRAGERRVIAIKGVDYAFRWCPPGTFMMGSPASEEKRSSSETQHQVTLSRGFWMLETEVTQLMWESVMGNNPSRFKGRTLPVESVSWNDCQDFITKLNSHLAGTPAVPAGYKFSLPTEAQWEYACRAGTTTAYHFGSSLSAGQANFHGSDIKQTRAVGSYSANAWGLKDMHGNVWEWCQDWYGAYPNGAVVDPVGSPRGSNRVFRGGSWYDFAVYCRSANRSLSGASHRYRSFGLRLALVSP